MSLNLKVVVPSQGVSKIMRFAEQMSVHEVCKQIQEKTQVGGKDHSLFLPIVGDASQTGKWLRPDKTLAFYDLKTNDAVEFRKRHDVIKIKLVDDTVKTMLVDLSAPVADIVEFVGRKINLKDFDEYGLQAESRLGHWLKTNVPLPEQVPTLDQFFHLRKRFFINNDSFDQNDPVSVHLAYCQGRDDVLSGTHPVSREEAIAFASLQCQVQFGDYKPDKITNWKEFFPSEWTKKDMEKEMLGAWKQLSGMSELNARYKYLQNCKSLKTFGMTCFKVKENVPGKKKPISLILAFTKDSIIKMDYDTQQVITEQSFKHLLRWAASPESFTLDFGAHSEDYMVVLTKEGEAISGYIAGFIDLMLKKQKAAEKVVEEDDSDMASMSTVARLGGMAASSTTSGVVSTSDASYTSSAQDAMGASKAIERMIADLFGEVAKISDSSLTPGQRREQIEIQSKALQALASQIENLARSGDRTAMNQSSHKIAASIEQLIGAARQAAASGADPNGRLMEATKGVADALALLLGAAATAGNKPNDPDAKDALMRAHMAAQAALQKLSAVTRGLWADEGSHQLFMEMAKAVTAETQLMIGTAEMASARIADPGKKQQLNAATGNLDSAQTNFVKITEVLAAVSSDPDCRSTIEKASKALENNAAYVLGTAKNSGADPTALNALADSHKRIQDALRNLMGVTELPQAQGAKEAEDFTEAAQSILQATAAIMAAEGNPNVIKTQCAEVKNAATKLGVSGKAIIASQTDPQSRDRLANYLKAVVEASKNLLTTAPAAISSPEDERANQKLQAAAAELSEVTHQLIGDTGRQVAVTSLYSSAKLAAATTTNLCTSARVANAKVTDGATQAQLSEASRNAAEAVKKLVAVLRDANSKAAPEVAKSTLRNTGRKLTTIELMKDDLLTTAEQFAPVAYKLVATSKTAAPKVNDGEARDDMMHASSDAAKSIHKMLANRKALKAVKGQLETAEAIEEFKAALADLESSIIACDTGILQPTKSKEEALRDLAFSIKELGSSSKEVATTAKNNPEDIGPAMKGCSAATTKAVIAASSLAATIDDRSTQKAILYSLKGATVEVKNLMNVSKAVAASPEDPNLNKLLLSAGKAVGEALVKLTQASKGVVPREIELARNISTEVEERAEKELEIAAEAIENYIGQLGQANENARRRAEQTGVSIEEAQVTEAVIEASQAIAKSTGILVNAATAVQGEFLALIKEPRTAAVYQRDPQYAENLIVVAKAVAAAVQELVKAANDAALGQASEQALTIAAEKVASVATELVSASTVKGDPNSPSQKKLKDAASRVGMATQGLVAAAKNATVVIQQKVETEEEKYALSETKRAEMLLQMEILRSQKELEKLKRKQQMATQRQGALSKPVPEEPQSSAPTWNSNPTAVSSGSPTPGRVNPGPGVRPPGPGRGPAPGGVPPGPGRGPAPGPGRGPAPGGAPGGAPGRGPAPGPGRGPAPARRGP